MSALSRVRAGRAGSATTLKIRIPRRPRGAIARPQFERMVDAVPAAGAEDEHARVVLITGAAGAGKTTFLSGWAADRSTIRSVELMLRWAREPVRIILAGRSEPPIALHRLRLAGRLVEIRGRDLAFSAADAARLLAGHGVQLDENDLALLVGRTEGWAAAIRLAAISLEGFADTHRHVADFAGDDLAVADYFVGEILARLPPDVREFLVRTCVCDEVSPELATLLTDREDAGAVLEALVRRNVLTTVLGRHGGGYRYHVLLGSYLRAELERRSPALRRSLHRTAAAWFEEHEEPVRALEHAVAGEDPGEVAGLVRRHGLGAVLAGHAAEVSRIVETLRPDLHADPWIALVSCAAALDRGQLEVADRWLRRAPACGPDPTAEALHAVLTLSRARIAGVYETELAALDETVAGRSGHPDLDLMTIAERGTSRLWLAQLDDAERDLTEAITVAEADGRDHVALRCLRGSCAHAARRRRRQLRTRRGLRHPGARETPSRSGRPGRAPDRAGTRGARRAPVHAHRGRDRRRPVRLDQHGQDPHAQHLPQTRSPAPPRRRRRGPVPGAAVRPAFRRARSRSGW